MSLRPTPLRPTSFRLTRRSVLAGATASLAAPSLLRAQTARELVIVSFAGQLQEPHQWLARRMEARHPGLRIRLVPSESQDIVAAIKAAQGFSPFDAMPNGEPPHLIAQRDGYIQKLDAAKVPNAANVVPELMAKSAGFGVPASYSLIGIAYNEKLLKTAPKSWADLWNPEYRGKVAIPRASSNLGLGVLVIAARIFGGSEDNLEPGWAKLQELKLRTIEGSGSEEGTEWPAEKSYFALGLALEPAKAIGIHFDQDAIVWVGPDAVPQLILLR